MLHFVRCNRIYHFRTSSHIDSALIQGPLQYNICLYKMETHENNKSYSKGKKNILALLEIK